MQTQAPFAMAMPAPAVDNMPAGFSALPGATAIMMAPAPAIPYQSDLIHVADLELSLTKSKFGHDNDKKGVLGIGDNAVSLAKVFPRSNDVLCIQGKTHFSHEGNIKFRDVVRTHADSYLQARSQQEKSQIGRDVTDEVLGKGARFLWTNHQGWYNGDINKQEERYVSGKSSL